MAITGETKGTFRYTIKNIGSWVKSKFTPKTEKATYDMSSGTAYAGTSSSPQEPSTSIAYGGGGGSSGGGGGGGSSGGGGGSSSTSIAPTQVSDLSQVPTTTSISPTRTSSATPQEIVVQRSGGVKVGQSEYIGKAVVPYTKGKTANQIRAEMQKKATAKGYGGRGRWSARVPIQQQPQQQETFEQAQAGAMGLMVGGSGGQEERILLPDEGGSFYQQPNNQYEIYDPKTNTYKTSPYGLGGSGTSIDRQPTTQEQIKIDSAQERGELGYQLTGYSQKDYNELSSMSNTISSSSKELEKLNKEFETKNIDYIKDNQFVGTMEEYGKYTEDYNKLNNKQIILERNIASYQKAGGSISDEGYMQMPKVNVGGITYRGKEYLRGKNYSLDKFKGLYSPNLLVQTSGGIGFLTRGGSSVSGEVLGQIIGESKKYVISKQKLIPEKTIKNVYQPEYGTSTSFDISGKPLLKYEDIKIKAHIRKELYFTGKQLGQTTGDILYGVSNTSKYLVPYVGTALYGAEVLEGVKSSGGVKSFIKQHPLESALVGTAVIGGGLYAGAKWIKTPIMKKIPEGYKLTTRMNEIMGARIKFYTMKKSTLISRQKTWEMLPSRRYLLKIERRMIKKPKIELKTSETIGLDIYKKNKNFVFFPRQKLYQTSTIGERAIVYQKLNIKNIHRITGADKYQKIYEGVPFTKGGKEGYKKTMGLFKEYGFKAKDVKPYLKYDAPKIIEQWLKKGTIKLKNRRATGQFKYLIEQPKNLINKKLGIKTRTARTRPEDIFVDRLALKNYGVETKLGIKSIQHKEKNILDITGLDFKGGIIASRTSGKGMINKIPFKTTESISVGRYYPSLTKPTVFVDKGKTTLFRIEAFLKKGSKGGGSKSSKQYFENLYSPEFKTISSKPIIKPISRTKATNILATGKPFNLKAEAKPLMVGGLGITKSLYSGKGMYEQQFGVAPTKLKGTIQPQFMEMSQREFQVIKPRTFSRTKLSKKQGHKTKLLLNLKENLLLENKTKLKQGLKQKQLLKQNLLLKQNQRLVQGYSPFHFSRPFYPIKKTRPVKISKTPFFILPRRKTTKPKRSYGSYEILGRRWGKWGIIGKARTPRGAIQRGKTWTGSTLGVSFKIPKLGIEKIKGFRAKKEKGQTIFIEPKRKRIKKRITGSKEFPELQMWKNIKSPIKSIIPRKRKKKGLFDFY